MELKCHKCRGQLSLATLLKSSATSHMLFLKHAASSFSSTCGPLCPPPPTPSCGSNTAASRGSCPLPSWAWHKRHHDPLDSRWRADLVFVPRPYRDLLLAQGHGCPDAGLWGPNPSLSEMRLEHPGSTSHTRLSACFYGVPS